MLNLLLTIAIQAAQPQTCLAVYPDKTVGVSCKCVVTSPRKPYTQVCTSKEAPTAPTIFEVGQ